MPQLMGTRLPIAPLLTTTSSAFRGTACSTSTCTIRAQPFRSSHSRARSHAGAHSTHTSHATHDGHRSDVPRAGSMIPTRTRGGSLSPDFARGQTPMTEDEMICASDNTNGGDTSTKTNSSTSISQTTARPGTHTTTPTTPTPTRPPAGDALSSAEEAHFVRAYSTAELRTLHCARTQEEDWGALSFPIASPSRLSLHTFPPPSYLSSPVRIDTDADFQLPSTIFAIQDEPLTWPGADDDGDMGLESISEMAGGRRAGACAASLRRIEGATANAGFAFRETNPVCARS
ncbi:hypothetical protein C8R44DRAFT_891734 [Mycena epipterygia]|nr:hypothetical protein C8R44DRAFT_891734 [Mycena epipterygia]